jgi:hypothetical protein
VTPTYTASAAAAAVVVVVDDDDDDDDDDVMLYELAVQDLALTHFASFSIVLNLSWYEALTL